MGVPVTAYRATVSTTLGNTGGRRLNGSPHDSVWEASARAARASGNFAIERIGEAKVKGVVKQGQPTVFS
jgi:hypothetical protein